MKGSLNSRASWDSRAGAGLRRLVLLALLAVPTANAGYEPLDPRVMDVEAYFRTDPAGSGLMSQIGLRWQSEGWTNPTFRIEQSFRGSWRALSAQLLFPNIAHISVLRQSSHRFRVVMLSGMGAVLATSPEVVLAEADYLEQFAPFDPPTDLRAVRVGDSDIRLTWSDNEAHEHPGMRYIVERSLDGGMFVEIARLLPNASSLRIQTPSSSLCAAHRFRVRLAPSGPIQPGVLDSGGFLPHCWECTAFAESPAITPGLPRAAMILPPDFPITLLQPPPPPGGPIPAGLSQVSFFILMWDNPTYDSIVIQRSTDGLRWTTIARLPILASALFVDTGLVRGRTYHYRIAIINTCGQGPYCSVYTVTAP